MSDSVYYSISSTMSGYTPINGIKFDGLIKVMVGIFLYYKGIYSSQKVIWVEGMTLYHHVLPQLMILVSIDDTYLNLN